MPGPIRAVAFDILETVFSIESLRPGLTPLGLPGNILETWFAASLRDAFALAATDDFAPFRSVMGDALADLLQRHNLPVMENRIAAFLDGMTNLEARPDAHGAFATLAQANLPVVAVSNGAAAATQHLLERAALSSLVQRVFSVDEIGFSKPRREVYSHVARSLGLPASALCLVAAHPWDVHGARSAGLHGAFVARGQLWPTTMKRPTIIGDELLDTVEAVLALNG
ncbi:haloacid dehalogenase type II [Saliniramus sp.]|uniref:haloacid dehalogenase type II n=1 Tax=Saliniramus sp. TaxID=2986772 RepID=UPI002D05CE95|nr:haloacid dehalogenase type II [Saliniramus sp.]HMB11501.1 haloacid dehalogenase type II [Saliniramus sp.]